MWECFRLQGMIFNLEYRFHTCKIYWYNLSAVHSLRNRGSFHHFGCIWFMINAYPRYGCQTSHGVICFAVVWLIAAIASTPPPLFLRINLLLVLEIWHKFNFGPLKCLNLAPHILRRFDFGHLNTELIWFWSFKCGMVWFWSH